MLLIQTFKVWYYKQFNFFENEISMNLINVSPDFDFPMIFRASLPLLSCCSPGIEHRSRKAVERDRPCKRRTTKGIELWMKTQILANFDRLNLANCHHSIISAILNICLNLVFSFARSHLNFVVRTMIDKQCKNLNLKFRSTFWSAKTAIFESHI